MKASVWHGGESGLGICWALIQRESCLMQASLPVGQAWLQNPRPTEWLGHSSIAWNLAPWDTNSYGNTSVYIVLHFPITQIEGETKNLKCIALLDIKTRKNEPVWERLSMRVKWGKSFPIAKPNITRELDSEFLNVKIVPSLEWGVSIYSRSQSTLSKSSILCKLLSAFIVSF